MKLPPDVLEIIGAGTVVLRTLGAELRARAAAQPNAPELWLAIRDYEGLADRLDLSDERDWKQGFGMGFVSGQDLGVLDEFLAHNDDCPIRVSDAQANSLARLRRFLQQYRDGSFERELPR